MREISAGVYNLLKSTRRQSMSVSMLLDQVNSSDEHLESHLCTMLQSVRGTKQYWFVRQSDLRCMIREWGSPTLFLTFSCADYECAEKLHGQPYAQQAVQRWQKQRCEVLGFVRL